MAQHIMSETEVNLAVKVAEWRQKAREGTLSLEETKAGLKFLRAGRAVLAQATGGTKTKAAAKAVKPNGDDLLSELEGL